jgi:transposase-like protein
MTDQLRHGLVANTPAAEGEVEIDESLLCSWLRPHRGISQEKLPDYLGFFQFVHNARRRGKALLGVLIAALVM